MKRIACFYLLSPWLFFVAPGGSSDYALAFLLVAPWWAGAGVLVAYYEGLRARA